MKKIKFLLVVTLLFSILILSSCKVKETSIEEYVELVYHYHVLMEKENVCIDLRDLNTSYSEGHFKGFINYNYGNGSPEEFLIYINSMYSKNIYIFLIDENGEYVEEASKTLIKNGYKNIIICKDGYNKIVEHATEYLQVVTGIDDCGC